MSQLRQTLAAEYGSMTDGSLISFLCYLSCYHFDASLLLCCKQF